MSMYVPRFAALILAALALVVGASSAAAQAPSAPTNLHGFLLRADEPARESFARTPAFAWNPVSGADHYEFQLSTSDTFRDNAVIWSADNLQSPVASPPITLPWISGSPHSLYARVRAIVGSDTTDWSSPFGFDITPPAPPSPLPSTAGLLRWTPVEGADGYEVWLIDVGKMEVVFSNVLDEREFYTFHQTSSWIGTVRWRVRALRDDNLGRLNGVPVTQWGPWSPIYTSSNPAMQCGPATASATCPIQLGSTMPNGQLATTLSDVVSDGSATASAHKLMPGFSWVGNQTLTGQPGELFRVYVYTDKQCINRVFTSAVIGSPAYAPRPFGPLSLPTTDLSGARSGYLPDGTESADTTFDGENLTPSEQAAPANPTTTLPLVASPGGSSAGSGGTSSGSTDGSTGSGNSATAQSSPFLDWGDSKFGAPVDLWDTNWPSGGYYWTVVPVQAVSPGALQTVISVPGAVAGTTSIPVSSSDGFAVGDRISVGNSNNNESAVVTAVNANSLSISKPLAQSHGTGEPVQRTGGALRYVDMELPQDACAAGRVARFGIASEPSVTGGGDAFASGLSSSGTLTSAGHTTAFYKPPLIAWTPALRAEAYQVQWSKTAYPFTPEPDPVTGAAGILTGSTAYVLPVAPGTWYYRVRGYDYSLPTGSQQMGWSDVAKVTVAAPTFTIVGGSGAASTTHKSSTKPTTTKTYDKGTFSIAVPKSWREVSARDTVLLFAARDSVARDGFHANVNVIAASGRAGRTMSQWAADLAKQDSSLASGQVRTAIVNEPAGQAVVLTFVAKTKSGKWLSFRQYGFDAGAQAYVVTFTATSKTAALYAKQFSSAAASFRVG
jgi:hypothetical protein